MTLPDNSARRIPEYESTGVYGQPIDLSDSQRPTLLNGGPRPDKPTVKTATERGAIESNSGKWLYERRHLLVGALVAAPVMWRPGLWVVVALFVLVLTQTSRNASGIFVGESLSPATLIALPVRLPFALLTAMPEAIIRFVGLIVSVLMGALFGTAAASGVGCLIGLAHGDRHWLLLADLRGWAWHWGIPLGMAVGGALFAASRLRSASRRTVPQGSGSSASWSARLLDRAGEGRLVSLAVVVAGVGIACLLAGVGGGISTLGIAHDRVAQSLDSRIAQLQLKETSAVLACPSLPHLQGTQTMANGAARTVTLRFPAAAKMTARQGVVVLGLLTDRLDPWTTRVTERIPRAGGRTLRLSLDRTRLGTTTVVRDYGQLRTALAPRWADQRTAPLPKSLLDKC